MVEPDEEAQTELNDVVEEEDEPGIRLGKHWNFYLLLFFSAFAALMGQRMTWGCNFVQRDIHFSQGYNATSFCGSLTNATPMIAVDPVMCDSFLSQDSAYGYRMWSGGEEGVCLSYNMYLPGIGWVVPSFDGYFRDSQVFSFIANITGCFPFFLMMFTLCFPVPSAPIKGLRLLFSWACFFQCLTFVILASNICQIDHLKQYMPGIDLPIDKVECSLAEGGNLSVMAAVLYFVGLCMAPTAIPPPPVGCQETLIATESTEDSQASPSQATTPTAGPLANSYPTLKGHNEP